MKAVALTRALPIDDPAALLDLDLPHPGPPRGHDLLVQVRAVSVNRWTQNSAGSRGLTMRLPACSASMPPASWKRRARR